MNEIKLEYLGSSSFMLELKESFFLQWLILKSLILDILNLVPTERVKSESRNGPIRWRKHLSCTIKQIHIRAYSLDVLIQREGLEVQLRVVYTLSWCGWVACSHVCPFQFLNSDLGKGNWMCWKIICHFMFQFCRQVGS